MSNRSEDYSISIQRAVSPMLIGAVFLLSPPSLSQETQDIPSAEREVRLAENARRDAVLRNDTGVLNQLIADSFVGTLDDGRVVNKAAELRANRLGDRKVEAWDSTNVAIRIYGNAAVVTGHAAVKDRFFNEGVRDFTFRYTHVWAKLDGRWQLVVRHISGRSTPRVQRQ
ncbi:MAG: nuclear transport factor 2 family protein [Bryobacterales bacterium]|nr:nuclear transport factor 2 family protein [Bryobacterales bacterium]